MPKFYYIKSGYKCSYQLYTAEELYNRCISAAGLPPTNDRYLYVQYAAKIYILPLYTTNPRGIDYPFCVRIDGKTYYAGYWKSKTYTSSADVVCSRSDAKFFHYDNYYKIRFYLNDKQTGYIPWVDKAQTISQHYKISARRSLDNTHNFSYDGTNFAKKYEGEYENGPHKEQFASGGLAYHIYENYFVDAKMAQDKYGNFYAKGKDNTFWVEQVAGWEKIHFPLDAEIVGLSTAKNKLGTGTSGYYYYTVAVSVYCTITDNGGTNRFPILKWEITESKGLSYTTSTSGQWSMALSSGTASFYAHLMIDATGGNSSATVKVRFRTYNNSTGDVLDESTITLSGPWTWTETRTNPSE